MTGKHTHLLHGRALGATIGGGVCLVAALIFDRFVPSDNGLFSPAATIVTSIFVGVMGGLLFSSIIVGGREDDRATQAAREALARAHRGS